MKKISATILCYVILLYGFSQSPRAVTGKPDTSYTLYSANASISKSNPEAKIVDEVHSPSIGEEKSISDCNAGNRKLLIGAFYQKQKTTKNQLAILIINGGGRHA